MADEPVRSEFGKGFLYPLALFLAHAGDYGTRIHHYKEIGKTEDEGAGMWLYAAADHLYEFMPERAPEAVRDKCERLRGNGLAWRLPMGTEHKPTAEEVQGLITLAKDIFLELDLAAGVDAVKAEWA